MVQRKDKCSNQNTNELYTQKYAPSSLANTCNMIFENIATFDSKVKCKLRYNAEQFIDLNFFGK